MMRAAWIAALAVWPAPAAHALIGTPFSIGTATTSANTNTLALTTTQDSPLGNRIVCALGEVGTAGFTSATDSLSSTYIIGNSATIVASTRGAIMRRSQTSLLAAGSSITVTYASTSTNAKFMTCMSVSGGVSFDLNPTGTTGTSTTNPSISSGTMVVPNEILFASVFVLSGAGDSFTEASGWTSGPTNLSTSALRIAYKAVRASGSVTYAPTLGTARNWVASMMTFRGPACGSFMLLGVGGSC